MKSSNNKNKAFLIHISALLGFLFPFGSVLIPLTLWKSQKTENEFINTNGKEAVNFNITYGFYKIALAICLFISFFFLTLFHIPSLIFILFGIYALFELMSICLVIIAASTANKGEIYQYPMTVNFLK